MEAPPGFEPGMEVLQTSALPLGDGANLNITALEKKCNEPKRYWSGKRDSNPRLRPWQGRTLPLSYSRSPRHNKDYVIIAIRQATRHRRLGKLGDYPVKLETSLWKNPPKNHCLLNNYSYFRFHLVPVESSSSRTPRASRSVRI